LDGFFKLGAQRQGAEHNGGAAEKFGESSSASRRNTVGEASTLTAPDHVVLSDDEEDDTSIMNSDHAPSGSGTAASRRSDMPSTRTDEAGTDNGAEQETVVPRWKCARCSATLFDTAGARQEHNDYHFALDLQKGVEVGERSIAHGATSSVGQGRKRASTSRDEDGNGRRHAKGGGKGGGIKAFFSPLNKGEQGARE
jgi:hypothetical protein